MIHPLALVHETAQLGDDTVVWQFASVLAGVRTGPHCSIGANAEIGVSSILGESVRVGHGVFLPARSRVGDRVFLGPNVTVTDDRHPRVNNPHYHAEPPILEDDCAIGAGAVILPGVRIGRGALVGAGAVVTHDVGEYETWVGNPARARVRV